MRLQRSEHDPEGWSAESFDLRSQPTSVRSLDVVIDAPARYVVGNEGDTLTLETIDATVPLAIAPRYPHVRWWGDDVLVVAGRAREGERNAWLIDLDGRLLSNWVMGDDIEDVLVVGDVVYASYGDEGMTMGTDLEPQGLVGFDRDGDTVFQYERDCGEWLDYNNRMVAGAGTTIARCSWGNDLMIIDPASRQTTKYDLPGSIRRVISAMTVLEDRSFLVMNGPDRIYEWKIGEKRAKVVDGQFGKRYVRGLTGGRFLDLTSSGYRVITVPM